MQHALLCCQEAGRKKHNTSNDEQPESTPAKTTRSTSTLPTSNSKGILNKKCIFCNDAKKRSRAGFESLSKVQSSDSQNEILNAARNRPDLERSQRILS